MQDSFTQNIGLCWQSTGLVSQNIELFWHKMGFFLKQNIGLFWLVGIPIYRSGLEGVWHRRRHSFFSSAVLEYKSFLTEHRALPKGFACLLTYTPQCFERRLTSPSPLLNSAELECGFILTAYRAFPRGIASLLHAHCCGGKGIRTAVVSIGHRRTAEIESRAPGSFDSM